jgi:hypothetical protein
MYTISKKQAILAFVYYQQDSDILAFKQRVLIYIFTTKIYSSRKTIPLKGLCLRIKYLDFM